MCIFPLQHISVKLKIDWGMLEVVIKVALAASIWWPCALLGALAGSIWLPWSLQGALAGSIWLPRSLQGALAGSIWLLWSLLAVVAGYRKPRTLSFSTVCLDAACIVHSGSYLHGSKLVRT